MTALSLAQLQKEIGHVFQNKDLIRDALTHSSTGNRRNYERLEFLGDRVLGLVVAQLLYEKFPDEVEGDLARRLAALVQGELLAVMARKLNLGAYVEFSLSERDAGGAENDNILADVFEAVIGALYLEGGLPKCRALIETHWADQLFENTAPPQHPKTELQEWAQGLGLPLPEYEIVGQSGPDHAPVFDVRLRVAGYADVTVQGRSRQAAEREAAQIFMTQLQKKTS
jgi:ribonuclease-3